jgi:hypothetical protein
VEARAFTMYDARDVTVESLEQLAARAASGDRHALEQVVSALKDDVFGLAMRMLGHPADAQPDYAAPSHVIERIRAIISDGTLEFLS